MSPAVTVRERLSNGRLAGPMTIITLTTVAARGVGLLSAVGAAAVLDPAGLGEFALISVSAALFSALGTVGFGPLTTRAVADAPDHDAALVLVSFVLRLVTGACLALAILALSVAPFANQVLDGVAPVRVWVVIVVVVWGSSLGMNALLSAVGTGHEGFALVSWTALGRAAIVAAATVVGAQLGGAAAAATGAALGEALSCLALLELCRRRGWIRFANSRGLGERRALLGQAAAAGGSSLGIQASMWLGQFLVARGHDGLVGSAAFLLASRLQVLVTLVPSSLALATLPLMARADGPLRSALRRRSMGLTLAVSLPMAVVMCGAGLLLPLLSSEYRTFLPTVYLMAMVGVVTALNNVMSSIAVAEQRIHAWIVSDWVLAVVLLGAGLAFVGKWGAAGLAVAYFLAYAASVAVLAGPPRSRSIGKEAR